MKLKVKKEGRKNIYVPEKQSLKDFIKSRKLKYIHNFVPLGMTMLGADHDIKGVLEDIDNGERLAIFTNENANMGHSLAIIKDNKLECYDIGKITKKELEIN